MNEQERLNEAVETKFKIKGRVIFSLLIIAFVSVLSFINIYSYLKPDRVFSEDENRVLQKAPVFTLEGFFDGSFMKNTESYLTDQFPLRDEAIYLKSLMEKAFGKTQENGVYIGKEDFLFQKPSAYIKADVNEKSAALKALSEKHSDKKFYFALVPNSSYIYSENLPDELVLPDQLEQIVDFSLLLGENFCSIDTATPLFEEKENSLVFYKTDHHWTTRGAFALFGDIMNEMGLKINEKNFAFYYVSDDFAGTLKSKSVTQAENDKVEICVPLKNENTFVVEKQGEKKTTFFEKDKLKSKNKYEVFLGGNFDKINIVTKTEGDEKLLIVKDSYANCMLPMFTPYFSKITVVDPRYMTESLNKVISGEKYTKVLFLYNVNTFLQDTSLVTALEG